ELWPFLLVGQPLTDACCNLPGREISSFRQHEGKFIAAVARSRINRAAIDPEDIGQRAERLASHQVAKVVVNAFESVQVEQENSERTTSAPRALNLAVEHIHQTAIICKSGQSVPDSGIPAFATRSSGAPVRGGGRGTSRRCSRCPHPTLA